MTLINTNRLRVSVYWDAMSSWWCAHYHSDDHGRGQETTWIIVFWRVRFNIKWRPNGKEPHYNAPTQQALRARAEGTSERAE